MNSLSTPAIVSTPVLTLEQRIAIVAMREMFTNSNFFQPSVIRSAAKVMGHKLSPDVEAKISALMCIDFNSMDAEIANFLNDLAFAIVGTSF